MVSQGSMIVKPNAVKIRRIPDKTDAQSKVTPTLVGFAGATADAFTLLERLQGKLDEYPGQLQRAAVEVAKGWRTDKYLRRLEASLLVADEKGIYEMTGNGDVLGSHDGVAGVGSGSAFAIGKSHESHHEIESTGSSISLFSFRKPDSCCTSLDGLATIRRRGST